MRDNPDGVPPDAWARYVEWRRGEVGQRRSQIGTESRAHLRVQHTFGTRSFSVGIHEMV